MCHYFLSAKIKPEYVGCECRHLTLGTPFAAGVCAVRTRQQSCSIKFLPKHMSSHLWAELICPSRGFATFQQRSPKTTDYSFRGKTILLGLLLVISWVQALFKIRKNGAFWEGGSDGSWEEAAFFFKTSALAEWIFHKHQHWKSRHE